MDRNVDRRRCYTNRGHVLCRRARTDPRRHLRVGARQVRPAIENSPRPAPPRYPVADSLSSPPAPSLRSYLSPLAASGSRLGTCSSRCRISRETSARKFSFVFESNAHRLLTPFFTRAEPRSNTMVVLRCISSVRFHGGRQLLSKTLTSFGFSTRVGRPRLDLPARIASHERRLRCAIHLPRHRVLAPRRHL